MGPAPSLGWLGIPFELSLKLSLLIELIVDSGFEPVMLL